jgi:hypothetical protein
MKCEHFVDVDKCKICDQDAILKGTDYQQWMRNLSDPEKPVPILEEQIEKKKFKWVIPKNWKGTDNQ